MTGWRLDQSFGGASLAVTFRDGRTGEVSADNVMQCLALVERQVRASAPELLAADQPSPPTVQPVKRTGKALGFRSWKLEGYALKSANEQFGGWKVGEPTEAKCRRDGFVAAMVGITPAQARAYYGIGFAPEGHDAPHPDCECGLYALHAPEFMSRWHHDEPLMVHGAVLGWGRMEVHHEGFRAQYAQPVMLAFDGDRQPYNHCERVKAMGEELGLPVVEWAEFEAEARKLAEPVPEDLRPEAPRPVNHNLTPQASVLRYGYPVAAPLLLRPLRHDDGVAHARGAAVLELRPVAQPPASPS